MIVIVQQIDTHHLTQTLGRRPAEPHPRQMVIAVVANIRNNWESGTFPDHQLMAEIDLPLMVVRPCRRNLPPTLNSEKWRREVSSNNQHFLFYISLTQLVNMHFTLYWFAHVQCMILNLFKLTLKLFLLQCTVNLLNIFSMMFNLRLIYFDLCLISREHYSFKITSSFSKHNFLITFFNINCFCKPWFLPLNLLLNYVPWSYITIFDKETYLNLANVDPFMNWTFILNFYIIFH